MDGYCDKWVNSCRDYLIWGKSGVGKTYFVENNVLPMMLRCGNVPPITEDEIEELVERYYVSEYSSYEELFGKYMPMMNGDDIVYAFQPGPMAKILKKAFSQKDKKYALIIENITAGNAYEVLGDLFQLLDRKNDIDENGISRWISAYPISLSEEAQKWFISGEVDGANVINEIIEQNCGKIYLPDNLYVISTSTSTKYARSKLDTAFRRRFKSVFIDNDGIVYGNIINNIFYYSSNKIKFDGEGNCINEETWDKLRIKINNEIERFGKSEDKLLSKNFVKMVGEGDDRSIGKIDFINTVVNHLVENVFRNMNDIEKILRQTSVEEVIKAFFSNEEIFINKDIDALLKK